MTFLPAVIASDSEAISETSCKSRRWRHTEICGNKPQNEGCLKKLQIASVFSKNLAMTIEN
jgi:hypothetical protein